MTSVLCPIFLTGLCKIPPSQKLMAEFTEKEQLIERYETLLATAKTYQHILLQKKKDTKAIPGEAAQQVGNHCIRSQKRMFLILTLPATRCVSLDVAGGAPGCLSKTQNLDSQKVAVLCSLGLGNSILSLFCVWGCSFSTFTGVSFSSLLKIVNPNLSPQTSSDVY